MYKRQRILALIKAIAGSAAVRPVKNIITKTQAEKYSLVASRTKTVPVMIGKLDGMYDEETNALSAAFMAKQAPRLGHSVLSAIDYLIDGKRTTAEIARDIAFEFGVYAPDAVDDYVRVLIAMGFAKEVK